MQQVIHKYKAFWGHEFFLTSSVVGFLLLFASLTVFFFAGNYAAEKASNYVTDIVLNNTPVYDVDFIYIYGAYALTAFVAFLCLIEPKRIPFVLKSAALFILVRAVFISVTHISPFPNQIIINPTSYLSRLSPGAADLFFSGHTGMPFLMALIFWNDKRLRHFFIYVSIFFGAAVLLGHLHYTIDVLSAFFITYGIFHMSQFLFKKEWRLFLLGI